LAQENVSLEILFSPLFYHIVIMRLWENHNLAVHGVSDCQSILTTLNHFSHFLEEYAPHVQEASMIDRTVIVQYLRVVLSTCLQKRSSLLREKEEKAGEQEVMRGRVVGMPRA
jgi:hypothetical protein